MSKWITHVTYCDGKFWDDSAFRNCHRTCDKDCTEGVCPASDASTKMSLPDAPAVYAIYDGPLLMYVGSTSSLRNRFGDHKKKSFIGFNFGHIKFSLSRKHGDWAMRELRLIKRLKPPKNKNSVRG